MNEQDTSAFEKWFYTTDDTTNGSYLAWKAALEYEREKTKKMIDELNELNEHVFKYDLSFYIFHKIKNIIRKYKGERND